ncbi:MAG TPA: class I SAM-dependent methyltransferase [Bryobacteraceae bacterium]|nr:class I SAM-dependent methyltransferase [Bryobacteraceae bacterium]
MAEATQPDYGLDAPLLVKRMFSRAGWTFAFGLAVFLMNKTEYPGPAATLLAVFAVLAAIFAGVGGYMTWSSRSAKLALRDELLDSLALNGDEKVLDAGCGLGLMTVGIAKRLKSGKATGVDSWDAAALSGNSAEAAKANAKQEGVADKTRFESGDVRKLVYPEKNFDVAVSALAIHNFHDDEDRMKAVIEMYRVLRPGGKLLILDILHVGDYAAELTKLGAKDVTVASHGFLWCLPTKSVMAVKS